MPVAETPPVVSAPAKRPAAAPPRATGSSAATVATPEPSAAPPSAAGLREQQALLDSARRALSRGENQVVLETLEAHAGRYPESDLGEEREALAIKALIAAGQGSAAKNAQRASSSAFPAACSCLR